MSTNNVYSCVQPGTAPKEFFDKFGVDKKCLLPQDIDQAQELLPQLVKATVVSPATTPMRTKYPSSPFNSGNLIHTASDLDQIGISSEVRSSFNAIAFTALIHLTLRSSSHRKNGPLLKHPKKIQRKLRNKAFH
jgi:hypothetical protein